MLDSAVQLKTSPAGSPMKKAALAAVSLCFCQVAFAASVITTRLEDPKAIYVDAPARTADSSAALQAAIDKASGTGREGIVFIPTGRYTITRTIYLWPGVRLIGYGATRPVFVLPPNMPGFQKGMGVMVMFVQIPCRSGSPSGKRGAVQCDCAESEAARARAPSDAVTRARNGECTAPVYSPRRPKSSH